MSVLDETALARRLASLPDWSGDSGRISRTVDLAGRRAETLQAKVMAVADELNHHPVVEQQGAALTFILWTHSAGGVTEKDLDLAKRIDEVIARGEQAAPEA